MTSGGIALPTMTKQHANIKAEHVLVCLRYGIGDLTMELPVLQELRQALGGSHITALGAEPAIQLLEETSLADRLISYSRWNICDWYDSGNEQTAREIHQWLRGEQFDAIFDAAHTPPVVRNELYRSCKHSIDYHPLAETRILIRGGSGVDAIKEGVQQGWGLSVDPERSPVISPSSAELEFADMLLSALPRHQSLIGISVSTSSPLKTWPRQNFLRVINQLTAIDHCAFVLLAGPQQNSDCQDMIQHLAAPEQTLLVCNLHLRKAAALLSRCDAYIGNDSGLMHVAAAVGTTPVAIFGPTDPDVYLPRWLSASAACASVPCPHRKLASFGHPACVVAGTCFTQQHCINQLAPDFVSELIRRTCRQLQYAP